MMFSGLQSISIVYNAIDAEEAIVTVTGLGCQTAWAARKCGVKRAHFR
jgi:hypothetical protein